MSSLNDLNNEVHRIRILIEQNNLKMQRIKSMKNTTAKQGIYYNGKVVINDKLYKCSLASKDIILKNVSTFSDSLGIKSTNFFFPSFDTTKILSNLLYIFSEKKYIIKI